jgi:hypothetical protein
VAWGSGLACPAKQEGGLALLNPCHQPFVTGVCTLLSFSGIFEIIRTGQYQQKMRTTGSRLDRRTGTPVKFTHKIALGQ